MSKESEQKIDNVFVYEDQEQKIFRNSMLRLISLELICILLSLKRFCVL